MKSIRKALRFLAVGAVAGVLFVPRAEATPIISVSPASQNATVGGTVTADIVVNGLTTDAVGGVSFLLSFSDAVLQGTSFTLDPQSKMGFALNPALNDFGSGFAAGGTSPFEAFFLADASLNNAALLGLQGTGFTLATVKFTAIGPGLSALNLSVEPTQGAFLSDAAGFTLTANAVNGSVCVSDPAGAPGNCAGPVPSAVPEPATFGLLATGVAALVRRRRKAQK